MSDLVRCLTNDKLEFQYDVLESIINKPELLDVPIVVYSIAGPERTGKSFLLNLFWHLQKNWKTPVDEDAGSEEIPQVFRSVSCSTPVTNGIFMTTEPLSPFGGAGASKVAIFFLDTQGIQSGDRLKCKEGDIFTISLALSYMQIVNVKERIKFPDIDTYASLTLHAKSVFCSSLEKKKGLTVLVRDWFHTDEYIHGFEGGKNYIAAQREKHDLKIRMQCLDIFYNAVDCFLMPCPGEAVEKSTPKYINHINEKARKMFFELAANLFSTSNIQQAMQSSYKGRDFLGLAKTLNNALTSPNKPEAPNSSYTVYLDYIMEDKISEGFSSYSIYMAQFTDENGNTFKMIHEFQKRKETEKLVMNKSAEDMSSYVAKLHQLIDLEYKKLFDTVIQKQFTIYLRKYKDFIKEFRDLNGNELQAKHKEKSDEVTLMLVENNPIEDNFAYIQQFHAILHPEYEVMFDMVMQKQFVIFLEDYKELMKEFTDLNYDDLKAKHEEKRDKVTLMLLSSNPVEGNLAYVEKFHAVLYAEYEIYFGRNLAKEYAEKWAKSIKKAGTFSEEEVGKNFQDKGKGYMEEFNKQITDNVSRSVVVADFLKLIKEKFQEEIKRRRGNKRKALGVGATFAGLVAGGLLVLIPPLGAVAVGSTLATELVMAMMAGGIGVAAGSVTGIASVIASGKVYENREEIPPDIMQGLKQNSESKGENKEQTGTLNAEADGQQSETRELETIEENPVCASGQLTLIEDEESNDTGLGDENVLLIQEEVEFVEATQRTVDRIIELFKRGK